MIKIKKLTKLIVLTTLFYSVLFSQENLSENTDEAKKPLVSIHAEDTHLPSILAILAEESGYNIVTGPNVQSKNKLTIVLPFNDGTFFIGLSRTSLKLKAVSIIC